MGRQHETGSSGNWVEWCGRDASGSGQGLMAGSSEHGNELLGYIKGELLLLLLLLLLLFFLKLSDC
jgi:hypothetical protein